MYTRLEKVTDHQLGRDEKRAEVISHKIKKLEAQIERLRERCTHPLCVPLLVKQRDVSPLKYNSLARGHEIVKCHFCGTQQIVLSGGR